MREAAGAPHRAPAAAASPGCAQRPLPRARPRRPPALLRPRRAPTDPLAACVPRNGRVRLQERPAGQSPHTPGALEWRTLPLCKWAVGTAMLYGS